MSIFLRVSLVAFAVCAALGLIPAAVLAARARRPSVFALTLAAVVYVLFVLINAAGRVR